MALATPAFPISWYPLCRASELPPGRVRRVSALGTRLAVFRTAGGQVSAVQATCAHMGADLSRGRVLGECLECPLHHWQYDADGRCVRIPDGSTIPGAAKLAHMPCTIHYGLVFGFLGGPPTWQLPRFDDTPLPRFDDALLRRFDDMPLPRSDDIPLPRSDHAPAHVWTGAFSLDLGAPYQILPANAFDGQHFAAVHHRTLLAPPTLRSVAPEHLHIGFRARVDGTHLYDRVVRGLGIDEVSIDIDCWGANNLYIYNRRTGSYILVAVLPLDQRSSRLFIVNVLPKATGLAGRLAQPVVLAASHLLTLGFLKPDLALLDGLPFPPSLLLPEADACIVRWLAYWRALPKVSLCGDPSPESPI